MRRARRDRCCRGLRDDFRSRLGLDCCYTCGVALTSHSHLLTHSICHSTTPLSQRNLRRLSNINFLSRSCPMEPYTAWLLCHLFISCCTVGAKKRLNYSDRQTCFRAQQRDPAHKVKQGLITFLSRQNMLKLVLRNCKGKYNVC